MELPRQDPDQLLHAIRNDASTKKSGKLKIARETMWVRVPPSASMKQFKLFLAFGLLYFFTRAHTFVFSGKILTIAFAEDTLLEKSRWV